MTFYYNYFQSTIVVYYGVSYTYIFDFNGSSSAQSEFFSYAIPLTINIAITTTNISLVSSALPISYNSIAENVGNGSAGALPVVITVTGPSPATTTYTYTYTVNPGTGTTTIPFTSFTPPITSTGNYAVSVAYTQGAYTVTPSITPNFTVTQQPVAPCFLPATRILTPAGYRTVETLCDYDDVETSDGRSVAVKIYKTHIAKTTQDTAPYCIPRGAIAPNVPDEDLHVSGLHAIQDARGMWQFPVTFGVPHLHGRPATYYHLECPNYFTDNLVANNTVAESFRNRQGKEGITFEYCQDRKGFVRNKEDEIKDASEIPSDVLAVYC